MGLIFLDEKTRLLNIFTIITSIERTGFVHIRGAIETEQREKLLAKALELDYEPLPENNEYGVEQHMASAQDVTLISPFRELALELSAWVTRRFGLIGWQHVRPAFDDIAVQKYDTRQIGISPHKDSKARVLLIALVSLSGSAQFSTCRERDIATARTTIETKPGDIVLMRAPGFAGPEDNERPFHSVHHITGPRYVVALRVNVNDPVS